MFIDYVCQYCGQTQELWFARRSDAPDTAQCDACRGECERILTVSNLQFDLKGDGFYKKGKQ